MTIVLFFASLLLVSVAGQGNSTACPLSFEPSDVALAARGCQGPEPAQVTPEATCCKRVVATLQVARASYARIGGGVLLLPPAEAASCVGGLEAQLSARGVLGGSILSACDITPETISIEAVGRCPRLGTTLEAIRTAPEINLPTLLTTCSYVTTARSCYNCLKNLTSLFPSDPTSHCTELVQLAVLALGSDRPALQACFTSDAPPPKPCTAIDISKIDFQVIGGLKSSEATGISEPSALATNLYMGVLLAGYVNATGKLFMPDEQVVACTDEVVDLSYSLGIRYNSSDRRKYGLGWEDYAAGTANCSGIVTVEEWIRRSGPTLTFFYEACLLHCNASCQAAFTEPGIAAAGAGAPFINVVYCERSHAMAAFGLKTGDLTKHISGLNCLVGSLFRLRGQEPVSAGLNEASKAPKDLVGVVAGSIGGLLLVLAAAFAAWFWFPKKQKQSAAQREEKASSGAGLMSEQCSGLLHWFSYSQMKAATNNFSEDTFLGKGGSGRVYKGCLEDGSEVAVKELKLGAKKHEEEFFNEVAIISSVRHKNLVELKGCCKEGGHWLVVYAYMPNLSLDKHLYTFQTEPQEDRSMPAGSLALLDWPIRFRIALGATRGLAYLHEGASSKIIHRDVKPSNILLDANFNARVADFGIAKRTAEGETHVTTGVAGTWGYLSPEYVASGQLTEKSDVYALGVVLLEIVSGRRPVEANAGEGQVCPARTLTLTQTLTLTLILVRNPQEYLVEWAWELAELNELHSLIDPRLKGAVDANSAWKDEVSLVSRVAVHCINTMPALRPSMGQCRDMLERISEVPALPPKPLTLFSIFASSGRDYSKSVFETDISMTRDLLATGQSVS